MSPIVLLLLAAGGYYVYRQTRRPAPPTPAPGPEDLIEEPPTPEELAKEKLKEAEAAAKKVGEGVATATAATAAIAKGAKAIGVTAKGVVAAAPLAAALAIFVAGTSFIIGKIHSYRKSLKHMKEWKTQHLAAVAAFEKSGLQLQNLRKANYAVAREIVASMEQLDLRLLPPVPGAAGIITPKGELDQIRRLIPWNYQPGFVPPLDPHILSIIEEQEAAQAAAAEAELAAEGELA